MDKYTFWLISYNLPRLRKHLGREQGQGNAEDGDGADADPAGGVTEVAFAGLAQDFFAVDVAALVLLALVDVDALPRGGLFLRGLV